jgi:DNA polymerase-3 subunit delta
MEGSKAYVLHGESYQRTRFLNRLEREVLGPDGGQGLSRDVLPAAGLTPERLMAVCDTMPFLTPSRLVVVEGLLVRFEQSGRRGRVVEEVDDETRDGEAASPRHELVGRWAPLADYVARIPPTTVLVFMDDELGARNPMLVLLRPHAEVHAFAVPAGEAALDEWVRAQCAELGVRVRADAREELRRRAGANLWMLRTELEKLGAYASGREVTREDVLALIPAAGANIFAFVDALINGRAALALRALRSFQEKGASPQYLIAMVARQLRLTVQAQELRRGGAGVDGVARALGLGRYAAEKTLDLAARHPMERLRALHERLLQADLDIKTGRLSQDLALDLLVSDLAAPAR